MVQLELQNNENIGSKHFLPHCAGFALDAAPGHRPCTAALLKGRGGRYAGPTRTQSRAAVQGQPCTMADSGSFHPRRISTAATTFRCSRCGAASLRSDSHHQQVGVTLLLMISFL